MARRKCSPPTERSRQKPARAACRDPEPAQGLQALHLIGRQGGDHGRTELGTAGNWRSDGPSTPYRLDFAEISLIRLKGSGRKPFVRLQPAGGCHVKQITLNAILCLGSILPGESVVHAAGGPEPLWAYGFLTPPAPGDKAASQAVRPTSRQLLATEPAEDQTRLRHVLGSSAAYSRVDIRDGGNVADSVSRRSSADAECDDSRSREAGQGLLGMRLLSFAHGEGPPGGTPRWRGCRWRISSASLMTLGTTRARRRTQESRTLP